MWDNYEIRLIKGWYTIVHIVTGTPFDKTRSRKKADELLARWNSTAS